jgi:hypothetical protein
MSSKSWSLITLIIASENCYVVSFNLDNRTIMIPILKMKRG